MTAELLTRAGISLGAPDIRRKRVFWTEGRPSEDGRYVLVVAPSDDVSRGERVGRGKGRGRG